MRQGVTQCALLFWLLGCLQVALAADPYLFTQLDVPGATRTQARGINNRGQITGWFADTDGHFHGYLRSACVSTPIDVPDATATLALGLR
jgi:hypothetical protein